MSDVRDRDYFQSIYFGEPRGILFEIATLSPGFAVDEDPEHLGEALRLPKQHEHLRAQLERVLSPVVNPRDGAGPMIYARAPGRRRPRGPADPPPRPRRERARPARPRRRARPRAAAARRHPARAAELGGGYHWYVVPRVGYPDHDTFHAAYRGLAEFHDELWERTGLTPAQTILGGFSMGSVMSYATGLGPDRPTPAGILAFSGFIPTVDGWEPDLAKQPRVFIAHGRQDPIMDVELRAPGARAARGPRGLLPRVRRRPSHRSGAPSRRGRLGGRDPERAQDRGDLPMCRDAAARSVAAHDHHPL